MTAVATIAAGKSRFGKIVRHGLMWGIGHAVAVATFAGLVLLLRGNIRGGLSVVLDCAVGLMLLFLGGSILGMAAQLS